MNGNDNYQVPSSPGLLGFLSQNNISNQPPLPNVRIITRRGKHSEKFAEISKENVATVDQLVKIAEELANKGHGSEAAQLISIIRMILNNNHRLQQVVGETLSDIRN